MKRMERMIFPTCEVELVLAEAGEVELDLLAFMECKCYIRVMPRKIRDLIRDLRKAGFINRGGKGNHRNFVHANVIKPITISGNENDDTKHYQERAVHLAIKEALKCTKGRNTSNW